MDEQKPHNSNNDCHHSNGNLLNYKTVMANISILVHPCKFDEMFNVYSYFSSAFEVSVSLTAAAARNETARVKRANQTSKVMGIKTNSTS